MRTNESGHFVKPILRGQRQQNVAQDELYLHSLQTKNALISCISRVPNCHLLSKAEKCSFPYFPFCIELDIKLCQTNFFLKQSNVFV